MNIFFNYSEICLLLLKLEFIQPDFSGSMNSILFYVIL